MDIQSKVAARRAELARQDREAVAETRRIDKEVEQAKAKQRADALDAIAIELFDEKAAVVRDGDALVLQERKIPPLDVTGLRRMAIERLIAREARKLWSTGENWQVIGSIVVGICLMLTWTMFAVALLIFGLWRHHSLIDRYWKVIEIRHPMLSRKSVGSSENSAT